MKKFLSLMLSLLLTFSISVPVFADAVIGDAVIADNNGQQPTYELKVTSEEPWEWKVGVFVSDQGSSHVDFNSTVGGMFTISDESILKDHKDKTWSVTEYNKRDEINLGGVAPKVTETTNLSYTITFESSTSGIDSKKSRDTITIKVVVSPKTVTPPTGDTTAPTLDYTLSPAVPNGSNGWYTSAVTVSFTATDNEGGSGIKAGTVPATYTLNNDGEYEAKEFTVEDNAGNIGSVIVPAIKIDATKPVINAPENDQVFVLNSSEKPDWSATDATSGIFSSEITGFSTSTVGAKSYTITAKDNAGNTETVEVSYRVIYIFGGILQPINRTGSSVFKAGSTVPVKFQLTDANGVFVNNAVATIKYAKLINDVWGDDVEAISTASSTTGNLFRYDSTSNQYIFNLSTKGLAAGTYQLFIALDDGTIQTVTIGLR